MADKERVEQFLRTLLGTLTVGSVVAALATPPSVLVFVVLFVAAWVGAGAVAVWLVVGDGWARLEAHPIYAPRLRAPTATALFAGIAVVLKVAGTAGANWLLGEPAVGYGVGVGTSAVALLVAYAFAFWANDYLRAFVGTATVGTAVVVAFRASLGPLAVPLGAGALLAAAPVAVWLVGHGGYDRLRDAAWYRPRTGAAAAAGAFAVLVVALDASATLSVRILVRILGPPGATVSWTGLLGTSVLSLVGAYWVVYRAGAVGLAATWYLREPVEDEEDGGPADGERPTGE